MGAVDIPADPIARERERERLLTQANALRVKGQITDAREMLQKALLYTQGVPPRDIAPIHEQIGDLFEVEERLEEAAAAYATAHELDPKRVTAEKKFATLSLRIAEKKSGQSLADAMLRGDSIADLVATGALGGAGGKRNAGVAMLLSAFCPGFGQIYNRQLIKGLILLGIFLFSLLILSLSAERESLFRSIIALFALKPGKMPHSISPLVVLFAVIAFAAWLYSIVDAPFFAGKAGATPEDRPKIDKTGWEV
jgi:tetratricopeptide (TPR) repeat protein